MLRFRIVSTLAVVVAFAPWNAVSAQNGRALELEDYYRVPTVGSPRISPNGEWVYYTVSHRREEDNGTTVETFVVRFDGSGGARPVLHEGEHVTSPEWLETSRLRYEHGGYSWSVDPDHPTDPMAEEDDELAGAVSEDGMWRVFSAPLARDPVAEPELTDFERRHEARFRGDAFDWYPFMRDGRRFPLANPGEQPMRELFLAPMAGGEVTQLTRLGLRPMTAQWRPGHPELLFTADESVLDELAYNRPDLFVVTMEGQVTRLTEDGYVYSGARYSPDGNWISYVRSFGIDMIVDRRLRHGGPRDLYIRPADGGDPINLTADFDLDAGNASWDRDSEYLYFVTGIGGARHLFRVAPDGGGVQQVTTGERRLNGVNFDADLRRMTYTVGHFDQPAEVFSADIDGRNERQLSHVHSGFADEIAVASHPPARVTYPSYDGTPVEGFVLFPHGYDSTTAGRYPLIVVNHGGPHSASGYGFNFKNLLFAAKGYFVFLPNFRSSTGYGDEFKWGTWGAWGTNDGEDVLAGVDYLIERYPIDRDRVGSTGHSYGGILTNWLITRYPDRFKAAVSGAGESNWTSNYGLSDIARTKEMEFMGSPWEPEAREIMIRQSAFLNSGGVKAATLFVHGAVDYRVPLEGALQLYTSLKKQRVPTKLIIYEGMAHGIRGHWNNVHRMMNELRWWETYLKPETPKPVSSR